MEFQRYLWKTPTGYLLFLQPVIAPPTETHHLEHSVEWMLMGALLTLVLIAILFASRLYGKKFDGENTDSGIGRLLANKWYVDEIYDAIIVRPLDAFASFLGKVVDNRIIDGLVNGVGKAVQFSGRQLRLLQSGQVGSYVLIMVVSLIVFLILQLFWKP